MADFGSTVREWRGEAEVTLRDLAAAVGLDFTQLSKIETGLLAPPSEEKVRAIARTLGRNAEDTARLVELARNSTVRAADIKRVVVKNPEVGALLRRLKKRPLTPTEAATLNRLAQDQNSKDSVPGETDEPSVG